MKVVILAGGLGSRLMEETETRPKPMVEIGGQPVLWHIMKHYAHFGFSEFVIALGYKGNFIKRYFVDACALNGDLTVNMANGDVYRHSTSHPNWKIELVDTGVKTETGGRIKRLAHLLNSTFMLTFGDNVATVDLKKLLAFHKSHGKLATLTAVRPPARFGHMIFEGHRVTHFSEKPQASEGWINGGYFVLEPQVLDYIDSELTQWSREPMERLARDGQLMAYQHTDFWQCMDTLRDKVLLENLWVSGNAPWKIWE